MTKEERLQKEIEDWHQKLVLDFTYHGKKKILVGVDEVGRGPLAGPVVAAAVILPYEVDLVGVKDSKLISEKKREQLFDEITNKSVAIGIGVVNENIIDEINILQATFEAMKIALVDLNHNFDIILVDGNMCIPNIEKKQYSIVGGDNKSASISAASIIAKVTRDRIMKAFAKEYPYYDWEKNKGYGTKNHYVGIEQYGITPIHRKSFLKSVKL
ncbi:ribonuclease HII [Candidatus Epulonipiscium fishelsonii]|uniref:Ribonuclease HII n=1 Tax=Candidatus Epulonipiscium fishelsonii TaxID=77094 RepID=A0ACC8XHS4_9FIRM|nr:ribonuclease HII [Epulopiscium sp. SCG-D08WGA-EpuloA1]OON92317.1 MAG: ribonuclease HII [Epulopiscium sp. AS2M-Bin002]